MTKGLLPSCKYIVAFFLLFFGLQVKAQLPVCSGPGSGMIYYVNGSSIMQWDPTQPFSTSNPSLNTIPYPPGAIGLAVSDNINGPGPSPTFYAADATFYWYWDGTTWVNTNHTAGAVNPGAGGGYLYSLIGSSGEVYRYNGTGNATLIVTIADFMGEGPYDLVGDCEGNFYILNTTDNWLRKYSSNGVLLQTWTTTGGIMGSAGGGMAIIGNMVYYDGTGGLWSGPMVGSTINFTNLGSSLGPYDFASCSLGGSAPQTGLNDTFYYCGAGPGIDLVSSGMEIDTITWNVASGNAVITGAGDTVNVTATQTSVIYSTSTTVCGLTVDTFRLVVPTATIDAGADDTAYGCGLFRDTLVGSVGGLEQGVLYTYTWTPANSIVSGGNTLVPIVAPTGSTIYTLTVTTNSNQGGCSWTDSMTVTTIDVNVIPGFTFNILYGCEEDTVVFTNTSQFATNYLWRFGDGSTDTTANPTHIYTTQGNYVVTQIVTNNVCIDSTIASVDLNHPLDASFTVDLDTICQMQSVTFTNTSITTTINNIAPQFMWDFGDGFTSTQNSTVHQYDHPGVYTVTLLVRDFVPCIDTYTHVIVVDSQSTVVMTASDTVICAGQKIDFDATFLTGGLNTYVWNMGNDIILTDQAPGEHTYEYPGNYHITLNVDYNMCADVSDEMFITVRPYPAINLGEDTTFCPNAGNYVLSDLLNLGNPAASWIWNTGATTGMISVESPGTYFARVTIDGCSNSDSVTILKDCYIDIPNIFTPNGDNMNDYFLPRQFLSKSVVSYKMNIFNRWGQLVYETTKIDGRGWDGNFNTTPQPQGVYVYLIEVSYKDGRAEKYQGNVTLLR